MVRDRSSSWHDLRREPATWGGSRNEQGSPPEVHGTASQWTEDPLSVSIVQNFKRPTKTDIQECLKHMQTPGFHGTLFEKPHAQEGQSPTPPATRSHQNRQLSSAHSRDPQGAEAEGHSL